MAELVDEIITMLATAEQKAFPSGAVRRLSIRQTAPSVCTSCKPRNAVKFTEKAVWL